MGIYEKVFIKDKELISNFKSNKNMKCAFFDTLISYLKQWQKDKKIITPKSCEIAKNEIETSNDMLGEFLDNTIEKTNDGKDRIGKCDLFEMFKNEYPQKKLITMSQFISDMKDKGYIYKYNLRDKTTGKRGVFLGIKYKNNDDDNNGCILNLHDNIETLKQELEDLKKQKLKIQQELEDLKKKKEEPKDNDEKPIKKMTKNDNKDLLSLCFDL